MAKFEGYLPIFSSEQSIDAVPSLENPNFRLRNIVQGSVIALGVLGTLGLGYSFGLRHSDVPTATTIRRAHTFYGYTLITHTYTVPAGDLHHYMHFNKTFPQRPNEESNAAWASLFPETLGFVQHPELAPNVAGIAVFHELHCLVSSLILHDGYIQ
jgi:hypothetical protein